MRQAFVGVGIAGGGPSRAVPSKWHEPKAGAGTYIGRVPRMAPVVCTCAKAGRADKVMEGLP